MLSIYKLASCNKKRLDTVFIFTDWLIVPNQQAGIISYGWKVLRPADTKEIRIGNQLITSKIKEKPSLGLGTGTKFSCLVTGLEIGSTVRTP